jgi:hypothetical protein
LTARAITKVLDETNLVNQTMTVENKPGGGGAVFMAEYATQDKNNDYKLFVNSPAIIINNLKAEGNSPFGYKDTTPLAQLTKNFGAIVVKADSKFQSLSQLLEAIKQNPKSVTVAGGSAPRSMDHLVAILPIYKSGIDPKTVKYVSYDGGGEAIAAIGSFVAGIVSLIVLVLLTEPLSNVALKFGPAEYFSLMILGLAAVSGLAGNSMTKAWMMTVFGLLLSTIGFDSVSGVARFTYNISFLNGGLEFLTVAVGLFALGEVFKAILRQKKR